MYFVYSLLSLVLFVVVSPYFIYQAIRYKKYIGNLRERLGYLPISFNVDAEPSIWIHAVSVGEALTARALAADLKSRYPRLRLYLSTTTMAGQQVARSKPAAPGGRRVLLSIRLDVHRPAHAESREATALHHDGDRDLAEPAARMPETRHQDGDDQRPHLGAVVSALQADSSALPTAILADVAIASACRERRRVCAPA